MSVLDFPLRRREYTPAEQRLIDGAHWWLEGAEGEVDELASTLGRDTAAGRHAEQVQDAIQAALEGLGKLGLPTPYV